jgi:formylglycine-generating enzyme required for sulfatase activity
MTSHDAEALRRLAPILRFFGRRDRGFLQSRGWVPHAPLLASGGGIYASEWPVAEETLWTLVNQGKNDSTGPLLAVAANDTRHYYDCYRGVPLKPALGALSLTVEQSGYGCVFATPNATLSSEAQALMSKMRGLTQRRLDSFSQTWTALPQTMRPIQPTRNHSQPPRGMVLIPTASSYEFVVSGQEIEPGSANPHATPQGPNGEGEEGVDVQFPWESVSGYNHRHRMAVPAFYIDRTPVTRKAYADYLEASHYSPEDTTNFLTNWTRQGTRWVFDATDAEKPVTHVSLAEAREYCAFYERRLPHSWEWQLAAQGLDGRLFPWGNDTASAVDGRHCPRFNMGTTGDDQAGLSNVTAFPSGASPYGVLDMVGNVWQYTSEFIDEHGRAVLLRGGSHYLPCCNATIDTCPSGAACTDLSSERPDKWGGDWYFPNGPKLRQLNTHGHYHLMAASYERAGTIGFRCAADAVQDRHWT